MLEMNKAVSRWITAGRSYGDLLTCCHFQVITNQWYLADRRSPFAAAVVGDERELLWAVV
jgi:hypothetical protein